MRNYAVDDRVITTVKDSQRSSATVIYGMINKDWVDRFPKLQTPSLPTKGIFLLIYNNVGSLKIEFWPLVGLTSVAANKFDKM